MVKNYVHPLMLIHVIFVFLTISTTSSRLDKGDQLMVVNFISGLPQNSDAWELRCGNESINEHHAYLRSGEQDRWRTKKKVGYSCEALWGNQFSYWKVYEPGKDDSDVKSTVFWMARDDGFYRSVDESSWTREKEWDHE